MSIQHDINESIGVEHSSSSVTIHISDRLATTSSSFPIHTIFKVHKMLRRENEKAYEPNMVAIGPYHRGKDSLRVMEDRKLRWFKSCLEERGESDATKYVEAMKNLEPEARQCYSESTENLRLGVICRCSIRDMLLFENQIPLFVLQELFSMIRVRQKEPTHFHELALEFLTVWLRDRFDIPKDPLSLSHENDIPHILGLSHYILCSVAVNHDNAHNLSNETTKAKYWTLQLRKTKGFKFISNQLHRCRWFNQNDRNNNHDGLKFESIPRAVKLHVAGVKFKMKKVESNPFEISFKNGVMEIPKFNIGNGTERLYRNLIAYKQYNQEASNRCVCLHAQIMDRLIDSADDVALVRSVGIIRSFIGEDEAISSMFNKLINEVRSIVHSEAQNKLYKDVNAYYGKRRHKWMSKLRSDYFNSPWALISFFAAVILLLLTIIQTAFSILGGA